MISLFVGENSFEVERALSARRAHFAGEVAVIDSETIAETDLPNILMGTTLFSSERLVIIRQLSQNKSLWTALVDWLPRISADTEVVFVETKPDKRTKTYKDLVKVATVQEFPAWSDRDSGRAEQWLAAEATSRGVSLDTKSVRHLMARVGVDQWRLSSELDKLSAIDQITPERIDEIVEPTPTENVFLLFSTALDGNHRQVQSMLATLRLNEDPYMVFGLLSGQVIQLAALTVSSAPPADVAKAIGAHPFALSKLAPYARRLSAPRAKQLVGLFADTDREIKSTGVDPWIAIERTLQQVAV